MEDYKKKYEEALERAKIEMSKDGMKNDVIAMHLAETIFPEFQEDSEDERIRKELLEHCKNLAEPYILTGNECPQIQSWIAWLEKQGKQKSFTEVKPRFNSGDWVVSNLDGKIRQISEVHFDEYNSYYIVNGKSVNLEEYDRLHHLWTIKDAKDGDILQLGKVTAIFQKYIGSGNCKCYCSVYDGEFEIPSQDSSYGCHNVIPATKEQCSELFLKMHEAGYEWNCLTKNLINIEESGYEWDVKNRKLKKIGEEPQLKEGKYYECIKSYHNLGGKYWFDEGKVYFCEKDGYLRSDPNNLIKVYDCKNWQSYFRPYTENPAWSEEDEIDKEILNAAILFVMNSTDEFACNGVSKEDVVNWLKKFDLKI